MRMTIINQQSHTIDGKVSILGFVFRKAQMIRSTNISQQLWRWCDGQWLLGGMAPFSVRHQAASVSSPPIFQRNSSLLPQRHSFYYTNSLKTDLVTLHLREGLLPLSRRKPAFLLLLCHHKHLNQLKMDQPLRRSVRTEGDWLFALQIRILLQVVSWTEWCEIRLNKLTEIKNGSRLHGYIPGRHRQTLITCHVFVIYKKTTFEDWLTQWFMLPRLDWCDSGWLVTCWPCLMFLPILLIENESLNNGAVL